MQMDEGLDTGAILLQHSCSIAEKDTAKTLQDKLAIQGASGILEALHLLQENHLVPVMQNDAAACYADKLLKDEARIDWLKDAQVIERAVRAFNPFPVCQAELNGVMFKIWEAALCPDMRGNPGEVLVADSQGVTVACGDAALRLEVLQRPGGKAQPAAQFLQAVPIKVGDNFAVN
jgi:methionyl-tRNA formyltransferase